MKFGRTLEQCRIPEWSEYYIDFTKRKKSLKACITENGVKEDLLEEWYRGLEEDLDRVNGHHELIVDHLSKHLDAIEDDAVVFQRTRSKSKDAVALDSPDPESGDLNFVELTTGEQKQLQQSIDKQLLKINKEIKRLEDFSRTNDTAFRKIVKKHDKKTGICKMNWLEMEKGRRAFSDASVFERLRGKVKELSERCGELRQEDFWQISGSEDKHNVGEVFCYAFILGMITLALADIAVLCVWMDHTNPHYDVEAFVGTLPIFRFFFHLVLMVWTVGACLNICESYGVNYGFLLGVDPRCQIRASHFYSLASLQSAIWVFVFFFYLADYKFALFSDYASFHRYRMYPYVLISGFFISLGLPSHAFRYRYRKQLFGCFFSVFKAPFVEVTFAANVVGDILTSFARPLKDVEYMACYLTSSLSAQYDRDAGQSETCVTQSANFWITPVVIMFPYWFRFLQCIRRYLDSVKAGNSRGLLRNPHFWNSMKYVCGMTVPVVSTYYPGLTLQTVVASCIATTYMIVWDIYMDWGLGLQWLDSRQTLYARHAYRYATVADIVFRFAWALTLVPLPRLRYLCLSSSTQTDYSGECPQLLSEEIVLFFASAIEIIRRAMWACFRLENEHLTNSSKFRAICWVPPLVHAQGTNILDKSPKKRAISGGISQQGSRVEFSGVGEISDKAFEASLKEPLLAAFDQAAKSSDGTENGKEKKDKKEKKEKKKKDKEAKGNASDSSESD